MFLTFSFGKDDHGSHGESQQQKDTSTPCCNCYNSHKIVNGCCGYYIKIKGLTVNFL